jgi:hypothetical protein
VLTKGDDYPIHQAAVPVAQAPDRNFYDRYFFNGYDPEGSVYFAVALGVYPGLDVMDAALSVIHRGVQHNVRASRVMGMERMDTRVGPIRVEVIEPLRKLRFVVEPNEHGLAADVTFTARARPLEEPPFVRAIGPRVFMNSTRLTQHGTYEGWIEVEGERIEVEPSTFRGVRDRSWGIRPVGEREPIGAIQPVPQYYWLWAPMNFDESVGLFDVNEDGDGVRWHENGVISGLGDAEPEQMARASYRLAYRSGTRQIESMDITLVDREGGEQQIDLEPVFPFFMMGIGYTHPEWGHGTYKGDLAVGGERFALKEVDPRLPQFQHVQWFCRATAGEKRGVATLEQLIIGPHAPTGLRDVLDMAP